MSKPAGPPISGFVSVEPGVHFDAIQRALTAINAVHGDGNLPGVVAESVQLLDLTTGGYSSSDRRIRVGVNPAPHPELTVIHEMGHAIDDLLLGTGHGHPYGSEASSELSDWRAAVRASRAYRGLRAVKLTGLVAIRRRTHPAEAGRADYLLHWHELFARSYTQFVALACTDSLVRRQLDDVRANRVHMAYNEFWTDRDFRAIKRAIVVLMRRRRWMT